ncbi:MAG: FKBP-type peptidyl-prolyl cis-trans isomerase [Gemmatimonadota bacterium]|nr:FKBP-type peptidyl-prolyl cis-trans isomerase [Gemmatimonadota bacterium]MDH3422449.1 FKBP-type peptidyl-prolyl cis-trans isomerase [Gemmatimonadota bacterium]
MKSTYRGALGGVLAACCVALVAACGSDSPTAPVFEVIEDVTFADAFITTDDDTLTVDLGLMTVMDTTGIYFQDLVVGVGDSAAPGDTVFVRYEGWLRDGLRFDAGSFSYEFFNPQAAIAGFQLGMQGQQVGGSRLIIMPPEWAYGSASVGAIYPGAILLFEVQLDSIHAVP